jgi:hypothetical protein
VAASIEIHLASREARCSHHVVSETELLNVLHIVIHGRITRINVISQERVHVWTILDGQPSNTWL